ncbi:hypothetical protein F4808DRAFT_429521 [Astrocystis sublimbata]|nr:hypothetical protein F4808DRAFT_429521 [Astrocystis sublimbata]
MTRHNLNDQLSWLLAHINLLTPTATVPALPSSRELTDNASSSPTEDTTVFFTPTSGLSPAARPNDTAAAELYPVLPRETSRPSVSAHGSKGSNARLQESQRGGGEGAAVAENMGRLASKPNSKRPNLLVRQEQLVPPVPTTAATPVSLESEYSASVIRNAARNRPSAQNARSSVSSLSGPRVGSVMSPPQTAALDIIDLTAGNLGTSSISSAFGTDVTLWREDAAARPEPVTPSENSVVFGSTRMVWREDYASRPGPVSPDEDSVIFGSDIMVWEEGAASRPEPLASTRGKKRKSDQISQPPQTKSTSLDDFQDIMDILTDDENLHVSPKRSPTRSPARSKLKTSPGKTPFKLSQLPPIMNTPSKQRTNLNYEAPSFKSPRIKMSPSKTPKKSTVVGKAEPKSDLMLSDSDSLFGSDTEYMLKPRPRTTPHITSQDRVIQDSDDEPMTPPAHEEAETLFLRTDSPAKRQAASQRDLYAAAQDTPSKTKKQPQSSSQAATVAYSPQKAHQSQRSQSKPVASREEEVISQTVEEPTSSQTNVQYDDKISSAMLELFLRRPSIIEMKRTSLEDDLRQNRERFKMSLQQGSLEPREQLRRDKERLIKKQASVDILAKEYRSYEELAAKRSALIARIADAYEHDLDTDDDEAHLQELDVQLKNRQDSLKMYLFNADIKDPSHYESLTVPGSPANRSESVVVQATQAAQRPAPLSLPESSSQLPGMGGTQVIMQTQVLPRLDSQRPSFDHRSSETYNTHKADRQNFVASSPPRRATRGEQGRSVPPRGNEVAKPTPHYASDMMDYEDDDIFEMHDFPPSRDLSKTTRQMHQSSAAKSRRSPIQQVAPPRKGYESDYSDDIDISELAQEVELRHSSSEARRPAPTRSVLSETSGNTGPRKEKSASRQKKFVGVAPTAEQRRTPWYVEVKRALKDRFRMSGFRHNQLEAINATLAGKDAFILMPTGGGKSLCYQLPAVVSKGKTSGITVVVSPLLSLMQDQVDHLTALNISAATYNSSTPSDARKYILDVMKHQYPENSFRMLYVTPEMINKSQIFMNSLADLYRNKKLARLVIDEAHCVSQWGHDFRPDYKELRNFRDRFPEVPLMALTATATQNVIMDVKHNLGIDKCEQFTQSFNRPNLYYEVRRKEKGNTATIAELINSKYPGETGIVYTLSRKSAETIAKQLREHGIDSDHYHAGVDADEKTQVQRDWQEGKIKVVVATIAFGMGIDKPDVRFVIHQSIPKSLEGYYQETGRAGRDGEQSDCYLYYTYGDVVQMRKLITENDGNKEQQERQIIMLSMVAAFCDNQSDCRRVEILRYFGEAFTKAQCNSTCDNCTANNQFEQKDFTKYALAVLEIVRSAGRVTLAQCTDYLMGKKKKSDFSVEEFHGMAKPMQKHEVHRIINRLYADDALTEENVVNSTSRMVVQYFKLGRAAHSFLNGGRQLLLTTSVKSTNNTAGAAKPQKRLDKPAARATGQKSMVQFTSTLVSSPARKSASKKKGKAVATNDDEESDEDFGMHNNAYSRDGFVVDDGFSDEDFEAMPAPVARRRRMNPVGPPISRDARLSEEDLTDVQKDILESFFEDAKKMEEKIRVERGYRKPLFTQVQLREMGLRWTTTLDQMRRIPGVDDNMVTRHGNKLIPLIQRYCQQYQEIMGLSPEPPAMPYLGDIVDLVTSDEDDDDLDRPHGHGQVIEAIEDDDETEEDDDDEVGETSGYFGPSATEKEFMEKFRRANQQETSSSSTSKPRSRYSGSGAGGRGGGKGSWKGGKKSYAPRRSSGGGRSSGVSRKKGGAATSSSNKRATTSGFGSAQGRSSTVRSGGGARGGSSRPTGVGFNGIGLMEY